LESVLAGGYGDGGIQCDRMTTALVHRLGSGWRRQRRSGLVSSATDSKFVYFSHSAFMNSAFLFSLIIDAFHTYSDRPVKIGLLNIRPLKNLILCVVSLLFVLLSF
jgi:hypothetical protein